MLLLEYKGTDTTYKPKHATRCSAGVDIISEEEDVCLQPGQRHLFKTGLFINQKRAYTMELVLGGFYLRIAPKSGLAWKQGLDVMAGVVDIDYPAEIGVVLINTNRVERVWVRKHQQIAQIILERCILGAFIVEEDERAGGWGSTSK